MSTMIRVHNLHKTYKMGEIDVHVLRGPSNGEYTLDGLQSNNSIATC